MTPSLSARVVSLVSLAVLLASCHGDQTKSAVPIIEVDPLALEFGPVPVGLEVRLSVKVRNVGKQELTLRSVTSDAAAYRAIDPPATVAAGDSARFEVAFAPTAEGATTGTLHLANDSDNTTDAKVTLDGQGIPRLVCTACNTPPANYCTPGSSLIIYSQFGTCVSGKCQYQANEIACGGACDVQRNVCEAAVDAGALDAGVADAGLEDAGTPDAGAPDAGSFALFTTPGVQSFTVPSGVTSVTVTAWGGGGAGGNQLGATGGGGGYLKATLSVTPNETLSVWVAQGGVAPGNGAGASFVLRASTPLLVAAGGGGGGSDGNSGTYTGGAAARAAGPTARTAPTSRAASRRTAPRPPAAGAPRPSRAARAAPPPARPPPSARARRARAPRAAAPAA